MKISKIFAGLVAGLLAQGCALFGPPKDVTMTVHADTDFTLPERQCIKDSAKQWSEQTSGLVLFDIEYDLKSHDPISVLTNKLNNRLVRWTSNTPMLIEIEKEMTEDPAEPYTLLGQVSTKKLPGIEIKEMRLVMDRLQDPHKCRLTAIHEFGHMLNVPHVPSNLGNIMFPAVTTKRTACLKNEDLLMFCFVNDCANVEMKPCPDQPEEDFE